MKIVAISDTHHQHYYMRLPKGDVLVHAGDFSFRGERIELMLVREWIKRQSKKYKYIVCVAGNHDIGMNPHSMKELPSNVYYLQDSGAVIDGIKFYGSPYTVRFGDWGYGEPEDKLARRWACIAKDVQILITHGPPHNILDANKHGENCGSKTLYERVKQLKYLKHHIFGHIHENYGQEQVDDVLFSNVSILDEYYKIKNKPTIINYV